MKVSDILVGFLILMLFVYTLTLCSNKKMNSTDCTLVAVALVLLLVIYFTYMNSENKKAEGFKANIGHKMGAYSGLNVMSDTMPYDGLTSHELVAKDKLIVSSPVGSDHNLDVSGYGSCALPSVNGRKAGPKAMSMLAYNVSKPECCPSTYSSSMGCVCLSEDQKEYLARGGKLLD